MLPEGVSDPGAPTPSDDTKILVEEWRKRVITARDVVWKEDFDRMRRATQWATWGCDKGWLAAAKYRANVLGRHINVKVASLYARQPSVRIRPRQMLDSVIWDGDAASLRQAQMAVMQAAASGGMPDPNMAAIVAEAEAVVVERRLRDRIAKTLERLVDWTWGSDFKRGMKQAVRRALTCGVAWIRYDIVRGLEAVSETGGRISPAHLEQITDLRRQLAMIEAQMAAVEADGEELERLHVRRLELERAIRGLKGGRMVEECVVWSFPQATAIIPAPGCVSLVGLEGADWAAEEMFLDREQVLATYGVDVGRDAVSYRRDRSYDPDADRGRDNALVCVWHIWDRRTQMEMAIADGYSGWLLEPRSPLVYRPRFWPWEALVFNEAELPPGKLYPPSEVDALLEIQDDINQACQALREHRRARRPLWVCATGIIKEEEQRNLVDKPAFAVVEMAVLHQQKVADVLQPLPQQPTDPIVYDTTPQRRDMMLVGGTQDADLGPTSGATATEVAVAQGARSRELAEDVDALDDVLTRLVERLVQTLASELSEETVKAVVGPGAAWSEVDPGRLVREIEVRIRAGSSGRPNREMELAALERVMPLIVQIPGIDPTWLAEEVLRRLDDDLDLGEALSPATPSIVAINQMAKAPVAPEGIPDEQGPHGVKAEGGEKVPPRPPGPQPAMGASGALGPFGF